MKFSVKTLLSSLYPRTLARFSSKYNTDIHVVQVSGQNSLYVDGSSQSGLYILRLWRIALKSFRIDKHNPPKNILVCGVAGGTVIRLLHTLYPKTIMVGVDIDKYMIDVGKKYFGLGDIQTLTLVTQDARDFIRDALKKEIAFDMIVIDIFIGKHLPPFLLDQSFWESVKDLLNEKGILLLNYLREDDYFAKSGKIEKILTTLFTTVKDTSIYRNRFFFAQK